MNTIKALFLDRDGIINIDYGHVGTLDRLSLIPEAIELCKEAIQYDYKIIVITNQAGIAKGKYTLKDFLKLSEYITLTYKKYFIDLIFYFCPYHANSIYPKYLINHDLQKETLPSEKSFKIKKNIFMSSYRKPSPGMIIQASMDFNINIPKSIFVGDKVDDIKAAKNAGILTRILVSEQKSSLATKHHYRVPSSIMSLKKENIKNSCSK